MDLTTNYLGMKLRTPLVPSASPLSQSLDNIRKMEDAGAAAVVLYSLFEEQIRQESLEIHHHLTHGTESFAEALTYFPEPSEFNLSPEEYLRHIEESKKAVDIPIIASLNGSTRGGWTEYAKYMEEAGADALELNLYSIPTDIYRQAGEVEEEYLFIVREVTASVEIPVAVKLAPFFTNMANTARHMMESGARGLVLFNRFYQPDIDLENLEVTPVVNLSRHHEFLLPLRWIAILYGRLEVDFAATTGIHRKQDVLKMLMAGANVTMMCSALLKGGIEIISVIEEEIKLWMEEKEYESVKQMQGSMSQKNCPNPSHFERAQYIRTISSYPSDRQ